MAAIVGMAVFTQYWYWFPLTHFISLSFTPTAIIGLDQDMEIPSFKFHSATRPSMFDYPPEQEVKAEEAPEKVKTAVLSTTAQAKRRKLVKEKEEKKKRRESMDLDPTPATPKASGADDDKMDTDEDAKIKDEKADDDKESTPAGDSIKKRVEKEKVGYELENMSRVLPGQVKYISFPGQRYQPVKTPTGGVVLLTDTQPSEPKTFLELKVKKMAQAPAPGAPGASLTERMGDAPTARNAGVAEVRSGAADAAGVLTAVDEDDEDGEEAELPGEFEYQTDGEGGEDDE